MLRDDVEAIAAELRGASRAARRSLFTVGGLGPTTDDRTLEGVALGLGVPLRAAPRGRAHGRREVRGVPRRRLRAVPGAQREPPQDGAAAGRGGADRQPDRRRPGRALPRRRDAHRLPAGRARRARWRSSTSRSGRCFAEVFGAAHYEERSLTVELQDESAIADILRAAEAAHPEVYVKSRAKVLGSTRVIRDHGERARRQRRRGRRAARRRRRSSCSRRSPPPASPSARAGEPTTD